MNETSTPEVHQTAVLIVGGSLVGLSAAMFLAARGVPVVVVERHPTSASHPRAAGYTARTLEMFDTVGLTTIPEVSRSATGRRIRVESLAGKWQDAGDWTPPKAGGGRPQMPTEDDSPHVGAAIAQDLIEPMLRGHAEKLGADLWLGTEALSFEQDDAGVTAQVRTAEGVERTIRARYLIAADGNQSTIREKLGIGRQGLGAFQVMRSVFFRADLAAWTRGNGQFEIEQPGLDAFLAGYGDNRWALMFKDDIDRTDADMATAVDQAVGAPVQIEMLSTARWELTALIADRFQAGRVFIAGDAAHTLPPTRGGYGANTGIADAFNLAWKLAAVLTGEARAELLDSYDQERRPIAWLRFRQAFARGDYARWATAELKATPILDAVAIELGELHRSSVILGAEGDLPSAQRPDEWKGQPGTRAPHGWVERDGRRVSTLNYYGPSWVVVSANPGWLRTAEEVARGLGVHLEVLDARDLEAVAADLGIDDVGAALVRPDGIIAWRTTEAPDADTFTRALRTVSCRP
jgi:2-polyprenyl-6-methoxyphenol hydroxylase-like FAD-dependent oxidoreductase